MKLTAWIGSRLRRIKHSLFSGLFAAGLAIHTTAAPLPFRGILWQPESVTTRGLASALKEYNAIAIDATGGEAASAALQVRKAGFQLYYWFEVGRDPQLADLHPDWMSSIQGHPEWRRRFPLVPEPGSNQVIKCYPWVPIAYQPAFEGHLAKIRAQLSRLPEPDGIFLNDLQAGPSACGCGHPLCRWTTDYGPIRTAPGRTNAAPDFIEAVRRVSPRATVIPVWATECEEADKEELCGGVGCFGGTCWKALTAQLRPVVSGEGPLGLLLPYKELGRDLPRYGPMAGWIGKSAMQLEALAGRNGLILKRSQFLPVIQGWNVTREEVQAQLDRCAESGVGGFLLSAMRLDQSWEPRLHSLGNAARQ